MQSQLSKAKKEIAIARKALARAFTYIKEHEMKGANGDEGKPERVMQNESV